MKRREFLAVSALAGVVPLGDAAAMHPRDAAEPEYYELRRYHMLPGARQKVLHGFIGGVAIPALNRAGVGPVGAFTVMYGPNSPTLYLLLPHPNLASVQETRRRLAQDAEYQRAGSSFLNVPLADPAFVRIESSLMRAFDQMPKLEVPPGAAEKKPRIFELRTYESHSEPAAMRKVEMFNRGEIAIFRRTGLRPVFFGEMLIGEKLPNLTYMLAFDDLRARDAAWSAFGPDPEWKKLSADPYYADTVSAISDVILRPTDYSQI